MALKSKPGGWWCHPVLDKNRGSLAKHTLPRNRQQCSRRGQLMFVQSTRDSGDSGEGRGGTGGGLYQNGAPRLPEVSLRPSVLEVCATRLPHLPCLQAGFVVILHPVCLAAVVGLIWCNSSARTARTDDAHRLSAPFTSRNDLDFPSPLVH